MLWIIENGFAQDWGIKPLSFFKCDKDQKERLDRYAVEYVGDEPAEFGYVKIEGDAECKGDSDFIAFCCDSSDEMEFVYDRIADALLNHPGVIDLRGRKIRII